MGTPTNLEPPGLLQPLTFMSEMGGKQRLLGLGRMEATRGSAKLSALRGTFSSALSMGRHPGQ